MSLKFEFDDKSLHTKNDSECYFASLYFYGYLTIYFSISIIAISLPR